MKICKQSVGGVGEEMMSEKIVSKPLGLEKECEFYYKVH
jgi:hypothetical protein